MLIVRMFLLRILQIRVRLLAKVLDELEKFDLACGADFL